MPIVKIALEVYQVYRQLLNKLVAKLPLIQLYVMILHVLDLVILYKLLYKCLLLSTLLLNNLVHYASDLDHELVRLLAGQLFRVLQEGSRCKERREGQDRLRVMAEVRALNCHSQKQQGHFGEVLEKQVTVRKIGLITFAIHMKQIVKQLL